MARLIDANELTRWLEMVLSNANPLDRKARAAFTECLAKIKATPTIDAAPVKHAEWRNGAYGYLMCPLCGCEHHRRDAFRFDTENDYCPRCGAKMDGGCSDG